MRYKRTILQELQLYYLRWKWERAFEKLPFDAEKPIVFPPFIYIDKDNWPTCWKSQHVNIFRRTINRYGKK